MGDIVASALVQEGVTGVSSYVSSKIEEKASTEHMVARLEMALSHLEFALERTGKMPITYISLLRRRKVLKHAYIEGTDILKKHKRQMLEDHKETAQLVTGSFLKWVIHAAKLSMSSLVGFNKCYLTSSIVKLFEWYADCAAKFVVDVESSNPLQYDTFCYPLARKLLEGKAFRYELVKQNRTCVLSLWPICIEDHGIEVRSEYMYLDMERPEQCFLLGLMLRLSEDTDIVGITIKCLQILTSQFKLVSESAIGELTLLPHLQDASHTHAVPMSWTEKCTNVTKMLRPDPICCANDSIISKSSLGVPDPVIGIYLEYMLDRSIDGLSRETPPLYLLAAFAPHTYAAQQGFVLRNGVNEEYIDGSIQQMGEILTSKVADRVLHQPQTTDGCVFWYSAHGIAFITLHKSSNKLACPKPAAAHRRGRIALEHGGNKEVFIGGSIKLMEDVVKSETLDSVISQLEPTHGVVRWYYRDITARLAMWELSNGLACHKPMAAPKRSQGAAKRKR
ncbi:hypothetical protein ACP4OV_011843 [Aristida adscensionis]